MFFPLASFWMAAAHVTTTRSIALTAACTQSFLEGFSDKASGKLDAPCAADFIDGKWVKREAK